MFKMLQQRHQHMSAFAAEKDEKSKEVGRTAR